MKQVLVAHSLSHRMRRTTVEFVMSFGRYAPPDVVTTYHNIRRPAGRSIEGREFDALILPYDVLSLRSAPQWDWVMGQLMPLAACSKRVLAFPQDDYTYNAVLDTSLDELDTDVIFTPIETGLEVVYPIMHTKAKMRGALTGYVDEATATALSHSRMPLAERPIDVGQRVRMLPPWFGRHGLEKGAFAERFRELASNTRLVVDISTRDEDMFSGDSWYSFLGSCRSTIGQKGGASLCDPDGSIMRSVIEYQAQNPDTGFDEIEGACFPGQDGRVVMDAISPRLFDAAMLGTVQILVHDDYLGVLEPWVHYIPTDQELSNFDEVVSALRDHELLARIAAAAEDVLIRSGDFTYRSFVTEVFTSEVHYNSIKANVQAGVDIAEELQWRLSAELFEAVQRVAYLAWATHSTAVVADLVEEIEDLLSEQPQLVSHLDLALLESLIGDLYISPGLKPVMGPLVDVVTECFRAGAIRSLVKYLRFVDQGDVATWNLVDWIDRERLELDTAAVS